MTPKYRPDIDGLRAIAVLAIVLFHIGIDGLDGGYVGVDIFFVISGFLITSIIARELGDGTFTIGRFYERRVRRILPALVVVLVATLAAGTLLLTPAQLVDLGKSALATSVFSSNIYFFSGSGYFDGPSEAKPLLHTWSLAVEEQFYIFFPLLLMFLSRKFGGRYLLPLSALSLASLAACIAMTASQPTAAFFLIPFRAWELFLGGLLALGLVPAIASAVLRSALAVAGLLLVLGSIHWLTPATPFPGVAALAPTVGTAMIIHAGTSGGSLVNRGLGVRPLVFVGLISYSLYLWHWPIVVYAKQYLINEPTGWQAGLIGVASLLLAAGSWRYVEAPFRDRRRFAPRTRLFAGAAFVSSAVMAVALVFVVKDGLPGRQTVATMNDVVVADPGWQHWKSCEELGEENNADPELCAIGAEGEPGFLLWGDSHALALASAVHLSALDASAAGLMAVRTGCPPLLSVDRVGRRECSEFNDAVMRRVEESPGIHTVLLSARWTLAAIGNRYKNEEGSEVRLEDLDPQSAGGDNAVILERGLERTVSTLRGLGRRVVLVGQVPEIGYDVPAAVFTARLRGTDVADAIAPSKREFRERAGSVLAILDGIRDRYDVTYIDPASRLCDESRCNVVADGVSLYRDDNHLSLRGCVLIAGLFDPVFAVRAIQTGVRAWP